MRCRRSDRPPAATALGAELGAEKSAEVVVSAVAEQRRCLPHGANLPPGRCRSGRLSVRIDCAESIDLVAACLQTKSRGVAEVCADRQPDDPYVPLRRAFGDLRREMLDQLIARESNLDVLRPAGIEERLEALRILGIHGKTRRVDDAAIQAGKDERPRHAVVQGADRSRAAREDDTNRAV